MTSSGSWHRSRRPSIYVDRNKAGRIVGAWEDPQRPGQELVPIDSAELQAFLAEPVARFYVPAPDGHRWG
jgi:hypothetical protein